jgi:membrane protein
MPARILRAVTALFSGAIRGWSRHNPGLLSAASAYNTRFSLAPLLLLIITLAGAHYRAQASERIVTLVDRWGRAAIAGLVSDLLSGMQRSAAGPLLTLISVLVLA